VAQADGENDVTTAPRFRGWSVVCVAFTVAVFAWGVGFYGPSVFLQTLHATRGWSISTISAAITAHFLLSAVIVAYLPEVHRTLGIANATIAGAVSSAIGVCAWASAVAPWQLFLAAILSGVGWAVTSGAAINAMVAPWFDQDRPKALGLAFNGASIGGVIFAPLWVAMIAQLGFQIAALTIGIAMVAVLVPLALRFLGHDPNEHGSAPNGNAMSDPAANGAPTLSRAALLRDKRFVTISLAFALGLFAQIGIFTHFVARLAPELTAGGAAAAVSLTTICAVFGRTLLGWFIGERDRRIACAVNFLVQAIGVILLILGTGLTALALGCVLFGLGVGNLISLPPLIAQREFGRADVGTVVALVTAINQAVFAMAPAAFGALRDASDSYSIPFALAAGAQVVAALIVVIGRR